MIISALSRSKRRKGLDVFLEVIPCLPGRDCGVGVGQAARSLITRPRATVVLGGYGVHKHVEWPMRGPKVVSSNILSSKIRERGTGTVKDRPSSKTNDKAKLIICHTTAK